MADPAQRRLAAILAADVAGYSRLMGADEEGTLVALTAHRTELIEPCIAEHRGRVVKTTGDGLLAEFASVVNAVRCAVAFQQGMAARNAGLAEDKRIRFRIGVNLGDVIVQDDDVYGDGVNVAARLEGLAEPGRVVVSGKVHDEVRGKLDIAFDDLGTREVKNIAEPIQAFCICIDDDPREANVPDRDEPLRPPDKPSIAVLPFINMSGDPEQDYFADGMTEDIITELSRFEDLFVIARNTSFAFKGQAVDVKTVARELGVRFILEGSVRKAGERVRITSQLVKGQDGGHVWAERYDGAIGDVFELQEQVTSQVVGSIAPQIAEFELERVGRGQRTFDDAHDRAWLAQETERSALRLADPRLLDRAIAMAVEAVGINAKCGIAYQTICHAHTMKSLFRWGEEPEKSADLAEAWAKKFFSELPNSYMAYLSLGLAKLRKGHYQDANRDFLRAHNLNPNDSTVLRAWAWCEASAGEFEGAKKHAHMAIRLSPKDTQLGVAYLALAMAAFIEKDHSNFEVWADNAIQSQPHAPIRRALMIAHAAEVGNKSLLETHKGELMRFAPDFIDSLFRGENQLYQHPEHMAALLDGLRRAGWDG